ncbi:MAG TPA: amidohydrolase family protein [Vicinamibacterales bacterium]|nr:amidohydrolase family protein [Vicinamibacterales bacterium]
MNDIHCHFFSPHFFEVLARSMAQAPADPATALPARLGWEPPGSPEALADRWVAELDRHHVRRAALMASVPGDEASMAAAVARHPDRLVGFFMFDPTPAGEVLRLQHAFDELGLRGVCLFPAMYRHPLHDERAMRVFETAAARPGTVVFVHCGVLSVGVRTKLGLPNRFESRFGNPLDLQAAASAWPDLPIVVPHFGAGFFREALMLADLCPNVVLDTSSSNGWVKYTPGLTLRDVFRQALAVVGPDRLVFGTDSSFFPRGWQQPLYDAQRAVLEELQVGAADVERIVHGNFDRLLPPR